MADNAKGKPRSLEDIEEAIKNDYPTDLEDDQPAKPKPTFIKGSDSDKDLLKQQASDILDSEEEIGEDDRVSEINKEDEKKESIEEAEIEEDEVPTQAPPTPSFTYKRGEQDIRIGGSLRSEDLEAEEDPTTTKEHTLEDLVQEEPETESKNPLFDPTQASRYYEELEQSLPSEQKQSSETDQYPKTSHANLEEPHPHIPHLGALGPKPNSNYPYQQYPRPQGYHGMPKKNNTLWHLLILVLVGGAVITTTVFLLKGGIPTISLPFLQSQPTPTPQTTATPAPTPTPTPEPEVNRADFTIRVLNGTTTTGLAGQVTDKLKEKGYKTERATNAPKTDYAQTIIRVKEGTSSAMLIQTLTKDLSPDYEASSSTDLSANARYDAEVILGQK